MQTSDCRQASSRLADKIQTSRLRPWWRQVLAPCLRPSETRALSRFRKSHSKSHRSLHLAQPLRSHNSGRSASRRACVHLALTSRIRSNFPTTTCPIRRQTLLPSYSNLSRLSRGRPRRLESNRWVSVLVARITCVSQMRHA